MRANAFFSRGFGNARDRAQSARDASERKISPELISLLRAQNETLPKDLSREQQIDRLSHGGCAIVATGQQVGLFLGPLYTIYKAASAVAIARSLTAETGVPCIPLFWLQTEDHDFPEICSCTIPRDSQADGREPLLELSLRDDEDANIARRSLGDRALGNEVQSLIEELALSLEGLAHAAETIDCLRTNYRPGIAPGRAFAGVLATLFADQGLLIFDPRCSAAARLASPVIRRSLLESARIDSTLQQRGAALREAGLKEQIELRPNSPLAFFHLEDERGPRQRLTKCDGGFRLPNSKSVLSERELLSIHEESPLRFSTSALLRPLFQDTLFPTAVYVGGAAEVSYFAQLAPLYPLFDLPMPLIAERAHLMLIPHRIRLLLEKMKLTPQQLDLPRDQLLEQLADQLGHHHLPAAKAPAPAWTAELDAHLRGYIAATGALDPSLAKAATRMQSGIRRGMDKLARRHRRSALARDSLLRDRVARLEAWLRPHGELQERVLSFPAFAARCGMRELIAKILQAAGPMVPLDSGRANAMREVAL